MTPTPTRPEPPTPTREAIRNEALEEAALVADDYYVASAQQEGSFDHKYAAETIAENIRSLKQRLTGEPAASVPVTADDPVEFSDAALAKRDLEYAALNAAETIANADYSNVGREVMVRDIKNAILLAASTGARGAVVEEIAKRHEARAGGVVMFHGEQTTSTDWRLGAALEAHNDCAKLLALIEARQP